MQVSAGYKWKAGEYPLQTGCSACKSLPQEAFDERPHALPRNAVECGLCPVVAATWSVGEAHEALLQKAPHPLVDTPPADANRGGNVGDRHPVSQE
jgi:hypothetical protein